VKKTARSARLVLLDNERPILAETEAIQSRIRQRAFELSQNRPPDVRELYDWIAAEAEVVSVPPVELVERDGMFDVRFGVVGVNPDDVDVMVTPSQIVLKSHFTHQHDPGTGTVHLCDFKSTTIFRSVIMPQPIDVASVKADFEEGMLHVSAMKESAGEEVRRKKSPTVRKAGARKSRAKQP
jgi:HSP20 family molecular chaperone IbpA